MCIVQIDIDGLVYECSNAMDIIQSSIKPTALAFWNTSANLKISGVSSEIMII